MKKLKLEKLKLNDLSAGDQKNVLGGNVQPASWVTTTTISIASYLINSCIVCPFLDFRNLLLQQNLL